MKGYDPLPVPSTSGVSACVETSSAKTALPKSDDSVQFVQVSKDCRAISFARGNIDPALNLGCTNSVPVPLAGVDRQLPRSTQTRSLPAPSDPDRSQFFLASSTRRSLSKGPSDTQSSTEELEALPRSYFPQDETLRTNSNARGLHSQSSSIPVQIPKGIGRVRLAIGKLF